VSTLDEKKRRLERAADLGDATAVDRLDAERARSGESTRRIVVFPYGFIYVGNVRRFSGRIVITQAQNVRVWKETKGLGYLALSGPTKAKATLDPCGDIEADEAAVIFCMKVEEAAWTTEK
jgi:hypothetical protein